MHRWAAAMQAVYDPITIEDWKKFIFRNTQSAQEACNMTSMWNMLDSAFGFMLDGGFSFSRLNSEPKVLHKMLTK